MTSYNRLSRFNHWSVALLVLAMLAAGLYLEYRDLPFQDKLPLLNIHKAVGVLLFFWILWRVGYRAFQGFTDPPSTHPKWQVTAAKLVHQVLLITLVLMPLSGLIMALYSGRPTDVFGFFSIPAIDKVELISTLARAVHKWTAYTMILALVMHIGAALKHYLIDKDQTLQRMLSTKP